MTKFARIANRFIVTGNQASAGLRLVFDIEADALLEHATKAHCIVIANLDNDEIDEYGPDRIAAALDHLLRADYLTGHNICGYDLPLLRRLYNWTPRRDCAVVDTLIVSRLILPNLTDLDDRAAAIGDPPLGKLRGRYSIEAWGVRLGIPKTGTEIEDWSRWTPEMQQRCTGDVIICKALWRFLQPDGYSQRAIELEHRVAPICEQITAAGAPFDAVAAAQLHQQWAERRSELATQLTQQFPGTKLSSRRQIGALLEARGWVPERRTEKTKQPKIDDELLETIPATYPEFAGLAEYMLLGRRLAGLATGKMAWCKHIGVDGRIHGGLVHIGTPHSRAKHLSPNLAQVPNPKKGSPFGNECRALFRPDDGWICVAADQSSLQDRGVAHYLHRFDGGAYARTFSTGEDTHWRTTAALGLIAESVVRGKDVKLHTALREGGKRFRYAFLYGAGNATAGRIIYDTARAAHQIDSSNDLLQKFFGNATRPNESALVRIGGQARKKFLAAMPGLGKLLERLENHADEHGWLYGLDGRRVPVRALRSALNFVVTSSEAIICKRWLVCVYDELCSRFRYGWDGDVVIVLWIHDELVVCCRQEIAEQVGEILVRHAKEPAEFYGFRVPLDADYKIGGSWAGEPLDTGASQHEPETVPPQPDLEEVNAALRREGIEPIPLSATETDAAVQPVTQVDISNINAGLTQWGIEPIGGGSHAGHVVENPGRGVDPNLSHGDAAHPRLCADDPGRVAAASEVPGSLTGGAEDPANQAPKLNGQGADAARVYTGQSHGSSGSKQGGLISSWVYVHPDQPKYLKVDKHIAANGKRHFYQHHWNNGRWVYGVKGTYAERKIPYRLPELLAAPPTEPVWLCEGEKDADSLAALGLVATTNPGGAKVFQPELAEHFKGKQTAYIAEDNDDAGREHTRKILAVLTGVVPAIAVVAFPELPEKGDVSDWLSLGGTKKLLLARAEQALRGSKERRALESVSASGIEMQAHDWVWPDRFAIGEIGLLVGMPDEGKGQCLAYIAARVTRGLEWPNAEGRALQGNVILLTAEDHIKKTVVPRLEAAGADRSRIEIVTMVREQDPKSGQQIKRMFSLITDLEKLRQKVIAIGDVVLILIDPVSAYLGLGKVDSYRTTDVRAVLGPLKDLAEELAVTIIGIMHFNKKTDVTNVLLRVSDSLAFVAAPRHVFGVIDDPDNRRKLVVRAKNNLTDAEQKKKALAFHFATKQVGTDSRNGKPIIAPFIVWEPGYVDVTASEALSAVNENKSPGALDDAKQFLRDIIIAGGGRALQAEIEEVAAAEKISIATLRRAKKTLKVRAEKDRQAPEGKWYWALPDETGS